MGPLPWLLLWPGSRPLGTLSLWAPPGPAQKSWQRGGPRVPVVRSGDPGPSPATAWGLQ